MVLAWCLHGEKDGAMAAAPQRDRRRRRRSLRGCEWDGVEGVKCRQGAVVHEHEMTQLSVDGEALSFHVPSGREGTSGSRKKLKTRNMHVTRRTGLFKGHLSPFGL